MMGLGMSMSKSVFIECLWTTLLTPTIMVMRGFTFQTLFFRYLLTGRICDVCVCVIARFKYRSWHYVNNLNWSV